MKKIVLFSILIWVSFLLVACDKSNLEKTEIPNGLEPIVAVNDCLVPIIDDIWVCIWADEFSGSEVDETKWSFVIDGQGGGNNELQYYRKENAKVENGYLIITAMHESFMGRPYTSARLHSQYKGDFQYVRVLVSAKMPSGRGTWPAIWMMPTLSAYGRWPFSGEIDIMEYVGYDKDRVHSTIHTRAFNHNIGTQLGNSLSVLNMETEFKEYEMRWRPGNIQTFVDGRKISEFGYAPQFNRSIPYHHAFPFDQLFHLILNLAVGGNWGGVMGVDSNAFPTTLEIDYVRVYQIDYATYDKQKPTTPDQISLAEMPNTLYWRASSDDYGVEKYAIYVDGAFSRYANLNQITLTGLEKGKSYQIQIQAIDFVGRTSELSEKFTMTIQ